MRQILTVKELIALLLDYNMDAYVYVNASGLPIGVSLPNVCFGGGKEGEHTIACSEEQMKVLNEVLNFAANHESPYWNDYIFGTLNNFIKKLKI